MVFREHMPCIDIVITDLMMPKFSGTELWKRIKQPRPEVPVALLTGDDQRNDLHPDFDLVLHKPLDPDFVEMVKRLKIYESKD